MFDSLGGGYTENTESVRLDAKASSSEIPISKKAHRRALVYEKLTSHPDSVNFRRCKYVSRRTQLACPNFCRASTHPRTIFCDEHRRYIQRLKTYADNEKKLNDLDLWIANHTDAEGSVDVCNGDDESLNVPRRPFSFEEHNYLPLDSGFPSQPFSGMDIMTEEEVLLKKISLLERKRDEIVRYRRSLAEDYGRRAKLFEMELNEEELKGKLTARTKKQKRLLDAHRCNEKYNQWKHSPIFLHAKECAKYRLKKRKLDSMATSNDDLDYLKIDYATYSTGKICAHKGTESTSETKKEGTSPAEGISNVKGVSEENVSENVTKDEGSSEPGINQPEEVTDENILKSGCKGCTSSAMLFSDFCSKHILDDPNQKLFVECSECGAPTIGREDGPSFCVTHMSVQPAHATLIGPYTAQTLTVRDVLTGFSSLRPSNQDLISSNISSAHSALASALNRAFESDELMKSQMQYRKRLAGGNFMGTTPLCASSEISLVPETTTKDLSDRQVQENATPVKKVVIDSDDEDLHASKDSSSLEKLPRNSSSSQLPSTAMAARKRREKLNTCTCARVRPFDHTSFPRKTDHHLIRNAYKSILPYLSSVGVPEGEPASPPGSLIANVPPLRYSHSIVPRRVRYSRQPFPSSAPYTLTSAAPTTSAATSASTSRSVGSGSIRKTTGGFTFAPVSSSDHESRPLPISRSSYVSSPFRANLSSGLLSPSPSTPFQGHTHSTSHAALSSLGDRERVSRVPSHSRLLVSSNMRTAGSGISRSGSIPGRRSQYLGPTPRVGSSYTSYVPLEQSDRFQAGGHPEFSPYTTRRPERKTSFAVSGSARTRLVAIDPPDLSLRPTPSTSRYAQSQYRNPTLANRGSARLGWSAQSDRKVPYRSYGSVLSRETRVNSSVPHEDPKELAAAVESVMQAPSEDASSPTSDSDKESVIFYEVEQGAASDLVFDKSHRTLVLSPFDSNDTSLPRSSTSLASTATRNAQQLSMNSQIGSSYPLTREAFLVKKITSESAHTSLDHHEDNLSVLATVAASQAAEVKESDPLKVSSSQKNFISLRPLKFTSSATQSDSPLAPVFSESKPSLADAKVTEPSLTTSDVLTSAGDSDNAAVLPSSLSTSSTKNATRNQSKPSQKGRTNGRKAYSVEELKRISFQGLEEELEEDDD